MDTEILDLHNIKNTAPASLSRKNFPVTTISALSSFFVTSVMNLSGPELRFSNREKRS